VVVDSSPPGWDATPRPPAWQAPTDQVIYELHVRDFSINDASVAPPNRGKYRRLREADLHGMRTCARWRPPA
jgi:pullulanase